MSWIVATHAMVANTPEKRKEKKGRREEREGGDRIEQVRYFR
jgi:hypothetical protein